MPYPFTHPLFDLLPHTLYTKHTPPIPYIHTQLLHLAEGFFSPIKPRISILFIHKFLQPFKLTPLPHSHPNITQQRTLHTRLHFSSLQSHTQRRLLQFSPNLLILLLLICTYSQRKGMSQTHTLMDSVLTATAKLWVAEVRHGTIFYA